MFWFNHFNCFRSKEKVMFYAKAVENRTLTNLMSPMSISNIFLHSSQLLRMNFNTIDLGNKPYQIIFTLYDLTSLFDTLLLWLLRCVLFTLDEIMPPTLLRNLPVFCVDPGLM